MKRSKFEVAKTPGGAPLTGAELSDYVRERLIEEGSGRIELYCSCETWAVLDSLDSDVVRCFKHLIDPGHVFAITGSVDQRFGEVRDYQVARFIVEREVLEGDLIVEVVQHSPEAILLNKILHELYPHKADLKKEFHLTEDFEVQLLKDDIYSLYWEWKQKGGFIDREKRTELLPGSSGLDLIMQRVKALNEEAEAAVYEAHAGDVRRAITAPDFLHNVRSRKAGSPEELANRLIKRGDQCFDNELYDSAFYYYDQAVRFLEKLPAGEKMDKTIEDHYADALLGRYDIYLSLGKIEEALPDCNLAVNILHGDGRSGREFSLVVALSDRAYIKKALALYEEALDDYSAAIDTLTDLVESGFRNDGLLSSLFLSRGKLYLKTARHDQARQDLENAENYKSPGPG